MLTDSAPKNFQDYEKIEAEVFDLKIIYTWVLAHNNKFFYVASDSPKTILKEATKSVPLIEAAGGLVENENNELLFIYRNDKWDIPKGKVEKRERIKATAVREVEEECGIKVGELGDKICNTYHSYINKGEVVIKKTHWYDMSCKGQPKLKPQKEEGISKAKWFKKGHISVIKSNTYPSILDVLEKKGFF